MVSQVPPGQAPAGQPPPIGFRTDLPRVDMSQWDEKRDRIFMMVLSAEEYISVSSHLINLFDFVPCISIEGRDILDQQC